MTTAAHYTSSVTAAEAALNAHKDALKIEGDNSVQLWHLLASLQEWAAVRNVDFQVELGDMQANLKAGELALPAAQAALRAHESAVPEPVLVHPAPRERG